MSEPKDLRDLNARFHEPPNDDLQDPALKGATGPQDGYNDDFQDSESESDSEDLDRGNPNFQDREGQSPLGRGDQDEGMLNDPDLDDDLDAG